jgi:hypothetical protein
MTERLLVAAVRISSLSPGKVREGEDRTGSASALVLPHSPPTERLAVQKDAGSGAPASAGRWKFLVT